MVSTLIYIMYIFAIKDFHPLTPINLVGCAAGIILFELLHLPRNKWVSIVMKGYQIGALAIILSMVTLVLPLFIDSCVLGLMQWKDLDTAFGVALIVSFVVVSITGGTVAVRCR